MASRKQQSPLLSLPFELQQQIYGPMISEWSLAMIKPNDYPDFDHTFTVERTSENALSVIPGTNLVRTCRVVYHIVRDLQARLFTGRLVCNLEAPAVRGLLKYGVEPHRDIRFGFWFKRVRSIDCVGTVLWLTAAFFKPFTTLAHFALQLTEQSKTVWDKYIGYDKSLQYPGDELLLWQSGFWADIVLSKSGRIRENDKPGLNQCPNNPADNFVVDVRIVRYYEHIGSGRYNKLVTGIAAGYLVRRSLSIRNNAMLTTIPTRAIGRWSIFSLDYEKDTTGDLIPEFQITTDNKWTWDVSPLELRWVMSPTACKLKEARMAIDEEIALLEESPGTLDPKWRECNDWYVELRRNNRDPCFQM